MTRLAVFYQKIIFIFTTMQCKVLLTFLIFTTSLLNAQNLVPNPSFEEYLECPFSTAELQNQVVDWYSWQESPDFFHVCSNDLEAIAGVPENAWGYQYPVTGEAYVGIFTYASHVIDGREYIAVPLISPLEIGESYYVMFYTSQYDGGGKGNFHCATNHLGAKFFTAPSYNNQNNPLTPVNDADIDYTEVLSDVENWTLVDGWFTADENYDWLALGNFFDDDNTDIQIMNDMNQCFGIYYVENVCVATSPEACEYLLQSDTTSNVTENSFAGVKVFPNPVRDELSLIHSNGFITNVRVYDSLGKLIIQRDNLSHNISIKTTHWSKGLYIVLVEDENGNTKPFKIIKQ
jgi:hypothetical protein